MTTTTSASVRRGDPSDELVLPAREGEERAVAALGLPFLRRADHDDGNIGGRGGRDRAVEQAIGILRPEPDAIAGHPRVDACVLDGDLDRPAALQLDVGHEILARLPEELGATRWRRIGEPVEHERAIEEHASASRLREGELEHTVLFGDDRAARPFRPLASEPRPVAGHRAEAHHAEVIAVPSLDDVSCPLETGETLHLEAVGRTKNRRADDRRRLAGLAAALVHDVDRASECDGQRVERAHDPVRDDLRRTATHDARTGRVRSEKGNPCECAAIERQGAVVAQQHRCIGARSPEERNVFLGRWNRVDRRFGGVERTDAIKSAEQASDRAVEVSFVDSAVLDRRQHRRAERSSRSGHLEIEAGPE